MPNETLEDFQSRIATPPEPPSAVLLQPTGDIEFLEPLTHTEEFVKSEPAAARVAPAGTVKYPFSWFHRSLAIGGALAIIAFLGISLLIAIYRRPVEPVSPIDVAADQYPADTLPSAEELDDSGLLSPVDSPFAFDGFPVVLKRQRRAPAPRAARSVYRPQIVQQSRPSVPRPQFIVSEFVPTTLIIYIENGEIKTRIEPQLTTAYKRSLPPGN
ncbi:MAG TPA: hypothetical protein VL325_11290 [Pyrinomonadaceae bacterium]|nr:hypothetical protein [Pyrinomonadaceae bacterium]